MAKRNPRYSNGNLRRKQRERLKAQGLPCGICKGARGPIHYDQPDDRRHPLVRGGRDSAGVAVARGRLRLARLITSQDDTAPKHPVPFHAIRKC